MIDVDALMRNIVEVWYNNRSVSAVRSLEEFSAHVVGALDIFLSERLRTFSEIDKKTTEHLKNFLLDGNDRSSKLLLRICDYVYHLLIVCPNSLNSPKIAECDDNLHYFWQMSELHLTIRRHVSLVMCMLMYEQNLDSWVAIVNMLVQRVYKRPLTMMHDNVGLRLTFQIDDIQHTESYGHPDKKHSAKTQLAKSVMFDVMERELANICV